MFSDRKVVIWDATGRPIDVTWPCGNVVRVLDSEAQPGDPPAVIPNAAYCPAVRLPGILGGRSVIYLRTGSQRDDIQLALNSQLGSFTTTIVESGRGVDTIEGSYLPDKLIGGPGKDTIFGRGGDDLIYGAEVYPDPGVDPLDDNDRLFGGANSDVVQGGPGDDLILGGSGDDWRHVGAALAGEDGNDAISGGPGVDAMNGGRGRDSIFARESDFPNTLTGGSQTNVVDALVDCGRDAPSVVQYATISPGKDPDGGFESADNCKGPPARVPTFSELTNPGQPVNGKWPWFP